MNALTKVRSLINDLKKEFEIELDIAISKHNIKKYGIGYITRHITTTTDGGYPVFLADQFVYHYTKTKDVPQALAYKSKCGKREIYVNKAFLELSQHLQDAVLQHEIGHLKLDAFYNKFDNLLHMLKLSNKPFICECTADDYAANRGYDIRGVLTLLRDIHGIRNKQLDMRIARLSK